MNPDTADRLAQSVAGAPLPPRRSAIKGAFCGATMFFLLEFFSTINDNIPRVPVAWLMMVGIVAVESLLFFRIVRLLRTPRRVDTFFVFRLDYGQRIAIARRALKSVHRGFFSFVFAALVVGAVLETVLMHERSLMTLCVVPCCCVVVLAALAFACNHVVTHRLIPCSRKDNVNDTHAPAGNPFFRKWLSQRSAATAYAISRLAPQKLRSAVMRDILYLLRGELFLTIFITLAVSSIMSILMLMVGDPHSPFVSILALVAIFMIHLHFASELAEAASGSTACHWLPMDGFTSYWAFFTTMLMPALLPVLVFIVITLPTLGSLYGIVRLLNFIVAVLVVTAIGCRGIVLRERKDSDGVVTLMFFAVITVGNFIPWAGAAFYLAALGAMILLDWEGNSLHGRAKGGSGIQGA